MEDGMQVQDVIEVLLLELVEVYSRIRSFWRVSHTHWEPEEGAPKNSPIRPRDLKRLEGAMAALKAAVEEGQDLNDAFESAQEVLKALSSRTVLALPGCTRNPYCPKFRGLLPGLAEPAFKFIGDTRLATADILMSRFQMSKSTVSRHTELLRSAGLVEGVSVEHPIPAGRKVLAFRLTPQGVGHSRDQYGISTKFKDVETKGSQYMHHLAINVLGYRLPGFDPLWFAYKAGGYRIESHYKKSDIVPDLYGRWHGKDIPVEVEFGNPPWEITNKIKKYIKSPVSELLVALSHDKSLKEYRRTIEKCESSVEHGEHLTVHIGDLGKLVDNEEYNTLVLGSTGQEYNPSEGTLF